MAFGPIHWFASFVIFFIVLGIITWSAVHLGKKDHNSTDIVVRFLDLDDYLILKGHKSLSTEDNSSTSRVIESTDDPTPNHQGYEISNIIEFYKVLQALSSTQNHTASGSMQNDNTTAVSATSVVANDSTWSENSTVTARQSSEPLVLDNRRPVSEKEIELQDRVSRPVATTRRASFLLDANGLQRTNSYRPVVDFLQDEGNVTSKASASFLSVHASSNDARRAMLEEATKLAETTQPLRSPLQNKRPETPTPSHFYVASQRDVTESP